MTAAVETQDRRRDLGQTIIALREQRQNTLSVFCSMTGVSNLEQATGELPDIAPAGLSEFLNHMVDYLAMGHFTIYQRIVEGTERRGAVKEAAQRVYASIGETTDVMVEFNDKYEHFDGAASDQASLKDDLSKLGEMLAIRGDLEDELLDALSR